MQAKAHGWFLTLGLTLMAAVWAPAVQAAPQPAAPQGAQDAGQIVDKDGKDWVLVDSATSTLCVYAADGRRLAKYRNIAIGRGGMASIHYRGDHTTPRGVFHIMRIRPSRRFDTFYLLDYPTPAQAAQAYRSGRLDKAALDAVLDAKQEGRLPPQSTVLGGEIGIHGIGKGSLRIHKAFNWTSGCVALTNSQLHDFGRYAEVGMEVIIR